MAIPTGYRWRAEENFERSKSKIDVEHAAIVISMLTPAVLKFAVLYATGTVIPKAMNLCVIGAAGAAWFGGSNPSDDIQLRNLSVCLSRVSLAFFMRLRLVGKFLWSGERPVDHAVQCFPSGH